MDPVRTYETVLHGQTVTVRVFSNPRAPTYVPWVASTTGDDAYQVDPTAKDFVD